MTSTLEESRLARLGIADLHSPRTEMADVIGETIATLKRFFAQSPWYQLEANIANRLDRVRNDVLMLVADELEMDTARWQPRGWPSRSSGAAFRGAPQGIRPGSSTGAIYPVPRETETVVSKGGPA